MQKYPLETFVDARVLRKVAKDVETLRYFCPIMLTFEKLNNDYEKNCAKTETSAAANRKRGNIHDVIADNSEVENEDAETDSALKPKQASLYCMCFKPGLLTVHFLDIYQHRATIFKINFVCSLGPAGCSQPLSI